MKKKGKEIHIQGYFSIKQMENGKILLGYDKTHSFFNNLLSYARVNEYCNRMLLLLYRSAQDFHLQYTYIHKTSLFLPLHLFS